MGAEPQQLVRRRDGAGSNRVESTAQRLGFGEVDGYGKIEVGGGPL